MGSQASQKPEVSTWTTGILGQRWRADVTPWGEVRLRDGSRPISWAIAADDRWHFPEQESTVRHKLVSGTPVSETRVRVPGGDVVQRVWAASLRDGVSAILMEFTNDSPMPLAISLSSQNIVTPRSFHRLEGSERPWPSEDRGIDRPPFVVPLGHRARMRVALPQSGTVAEDEVESFPDWEAVVRGWTSVTDAGSRIDAPDFVDGMPLEEVIRGRRSAIALVPVESHGRSVDMDARSVIAYRELVRMGLAQPDDPEAVSALERILRHVRKSRTIDPCSADALRSGAAVLGLGSPRALGDFTRAVHRTLRRCGIESEPDLAHLLGLCPRPTRHSISDWSDPNLDVIGFLESEVAMWSGVDEVTLIANGFGSSRLGVNFEAHRMPAGPLRTVSLAIRWHGERPAVIWQVDGPPGLLLRSGVDSGWSSVELSGEALWNVPSENSISP